MALSNGFHKFLDLIGIVSRDEPVSGRNERVGSSRGRYDDGGGDFSDENAGYDPPNVSRSERASSVDRYHGSTMSSSRMADYDEVGNMVEFKTNHQPYGQSAPGEYRQKTVIHYPVSYTHLDVYKRQIWMCSPATRPTSARIRAI